MNLDLIKEMKAIRTIVVVTQQQTTCDHVNLFHYGGGIIVLNKVKIFYFILNHFRKN